MIYTDTLTECQRDPVAFDEDATTGPTTVDHRRRLAAVCRACPMFTACRALALTTPTEHVGGFLAGLTVRERRRRQHRMEAVA